MNATFTPGEWIADWTHQNTDNIKRGWHVHGRDEAEPLICLVPEESRLDGCEEANARLIAAAPTLYEACERALARLTQLGAEDEPQRFGPCPVCEKIRSALAAARGE